MVQRNIKNRYELNHGMNTGEKSDQLIEESPSGLNNPTSFLQGKYKRCSENARKHEFVSRVYKDLGFICEV